MPSNKHHTEDDEDWDYAVPAVRSWDCDMDPVATARAAMTAASAAAASVAAAEARAATAYSSFGRSSTWSILCTGGPTASRSCLPETECQNALYSDDMYYATAEESSSIHRGLDDDDEREGIVFSEAEPPEPPPPRRTKTNENPMILDRIPPKLLSSSSHDSCSNSSICTESSSVSSAPPPPPPQTDDLEIVEDELRREVSSVTKWALPPTAVQRSGFDFLSSLPKLQRTSAKRVRFAHPIVTSLKHRPMTLEEEVDDLFFSHEELLDLEADREQHEFADDFQVEIVFDNKRDQLSVSYNDTWSKLPRLTD